MNDNFRKFGEQKDRADLDFYREKLCSVKQFVGNGDIYIVAETTTFNSTSVEVIVTRENGEIYTLFCDKVISNGIKIEYIDEGFLLYEGFENEELTRYITNCYIYKEEEDYIIGLDISWSGGWWDFLPMEEHSDERFSNKSFKILCRIVDYIDEDGGFYQNIIDKREFVITRFKDDPSPVRLLCSDTLKNQLSNGKNPNDLLEHYIGIYVDDNGEEFLRIFDKKNLKLFDTNSKLSKAWQRRSGIFFIIEQVIKNPFKYSFVNASFNEMNYLRIN